MPAVAHRVANVLLKSCTRRFSIPARRAAPFTAFRIAQAVCGHTWSTVIHSHRAIQSVEVIDHLVAKLRATGV